MKLHVKIFCFGLALLCPVFSQATNLWQRADAEATPKNLQIMHPLSYQVYTVDEATLKLQLFSLSTNPSEGIIITLPLPDGSTRDFNVWQTPMMPDQLAAKYPDIRTFTGESVTNHSVTVKLDFTMYGFHAMIFNGDNTSFIDPFDNYHDGFYMVHYKRDETRAFSDRTKCLVHTVSSNAPAGGEPVTVLNKESYKTAPKTVNGSQLRTYRLALACDAYYAQAATGLPSPTIAQTLSKMTTSMNRINGVYEREFSINMVFVTHEDTLIFTNPATDPYYADNSNAGNLLTDNQTQCDLLIGDANYDIGHVFTTGSGGLSDVGVICATGAKASSTTGQPTPTGDGFDIDYVAHEMGHEYGGDHPFANGQDGSCAGNNTKEISYEPGSGSTIMAYAGICSPDDLQYHSDPYFHAISLEMIQQYITTPGINGGDICAVKITTGNKLVGYNAFAATYSIPYLTPFELNAPVLTDSVADSATLYCWEEWDNALAIGDGGEEFVATHAIGPLFRSFDPTPTSLRVFPKMSMVLAGTLSNAGTEGAEGEKVPDVARTLNFICTFRDIYHNMGSITIPDDKITLNAINTGAGFAVTSQGSAVTFSGGSSQTVTWNVVTSNVAPINATSVDIYMSVDGGITWPYHVGTFPNSGSAAITVPNPAASSSTCRFKVKGNGNVFFNINGSNFTVNYNSSLPVTSGVKQVTAIENEVKVYPVPAGNLLQVSATTQMEAKIFNTLGQQVWEGAISGQKAIEVSLWARGIYYILLQDAQGQKTVKRIVLE